MPHRVSCIILRAGEASQCIATVNANFLIKNHSELEPYCILIGIRHASDRVTLRPTPYKSAV